MIFDLGSYFRIYENCRSIVMQFCITWYSYCSWFHKSNKSRYIWP